MARAAARLAENAQGEFYVDSSCIDCETCRIVAPTVFARDDRIGMSIVRRQPGGEDETLRATMALVACPTSSIGSVSKVDVGPAVAAFPEPLDGNVYYCGFASEESFGAASYFVKRDAGNVLVDSPRAARPLLERIDALGGVATMLLSHRDDVADHAKYARRFACKRTMHAADIDSDTANVELRIDGSAPVALADDLLVIPVPGHTRGSVALLYDRRFLFTGDHLWGADDGSELDASRSVCWYSWDRQTRSMETLLDYAFEWVLPGHGPRVHAPPQRMRRMLERLIARMNVR